jgi:hypothetical protein
VNDDVSLCPKCNSMTHTRLGMCGKCHADKPESFCDKCYHNKEAHSFGNCAYCNCKGFEEMKPKKVR